MMAHTARNYGQSSLFLLNLNLYKVSKCAYLYKFYSLGGYWKSCHEYENDVNTYS